MMKLRVIDQVSISAIRSDCLRPGEEVEVADDFGAELLHRLPHALEPAEGKALDGAPENKTRTTGRKAKGSKTEEA